MTEVLYETSIEICKPQEAFYFFYLGGSFPLFDCFNLVILYLNFFSSDYYS